LPSEGTPGAIEVGVGESEIVEGGGGLLLRNDPGSPYGWVFEDTTDRLTVTANIQAAVSVSGVDPELSGSMPFLHFRVRDGATYLQVGVSPEGAVSVSGGTYYATVSDAIDDVTEPFTLGILRNDRVEFWTVTVNGLPVWTVPYTALT